MTDAMTSEPHLPRGPQANEALLEQAARFRARLADAPNDPDLVLRIEHWKAVSPSHAQAFYEAEQLWKLMSPTPRAVAPHSRHAWAVGFAAALAALLLSPTLGRSWQDLRSDAVSSVGEQRELTLADGSRVTLASDTAMAFDIDANSRSVRMFRGEAFFAVKHDPAHPFRIQAGDAAVTVLGTRFDVRMGGEGTRVTVEQGGVRLSGPGGSQVLTAETQGIAGSDHTFVHSAYSADATAWRRGRAVFYDAPLPQVVEELNRYRRGTIYLAGAELRRRRITGSFSTARPGETLAAIRTSLGAQALELPGGVVLLY